MRRDVPMPHPARSPCDGDRDAARAFLVEARAMPGAAGDPWIAAIDRALSEGVSCAGR
ncbi:hypothetical protein [Sandaracinus amylolyticus]|uniref:Uncharacterized protein n=1 Tax=Sandaracinus amylolyticus TaxID=927083 RepID=A0A0F6W8I5_9BACT|nr:hypothetical protein [Sandaracinus amylolyticus]AKF10200.1 hypothetical protein DB32_007349 [Sandaracinus amylolyticus]